MSAIATIIESGSASRRISLYVRRDRSNHNNEYGIFTAKGEDAYQYRWPNKKAAIRAIEYLWADPLWDIQWNLNSRQGAAK